MNPSYILGLYLRPRETWKTIASQDHSTARILLGHVVILALLPALAFFYGVTETGWSLPGETGRVLRLTPESALVIIALFYAGMVVATIGLAVMVHWMAETYGSQASLADAMALAAWTCTPLFLAGIVGIAPHLLIDMSIGVLAVAHAVYLLYTGIPTLMQVPVEQGYLYAAAVIAAALVALIAMMGATVMLWEMGAMPVFIG